MSSLITDKQFKTAMGQFLTGVTIVSCIKQDVIVTHMALLLIPLRQYHYLQDWCYGL